MRGAPPVALVCDGGSIWRGVQAALFAATAAGLAAWAAAHGGIAASTSAAAVLLACLLAGVIAWRALPPQPERLAWDGERWAAGPQATQGEVALMIDLSGWLLLRFTPDDKAFAPRWLALSAPTAGGAWHGLRAALYGRRPAAGARAVSPERQPN